MSDLLSEKFQKYFMPETFENMDLEIAILNGIRKLESESKIDIKEIATHFYYHWHNSPGTNTSQGFDDWWKDNKQRFIGE